MLALLGFLTIAILLAAIFSRRVSPLVAWIAVPTAISESCRSSRKQVRRPA